MPPEVLTPLERTSLADGLVTRLRQAVIDGELSGGEVLSEPSLARRYGVSRGPVREALQQLERERLVEFSGSGRTRVRDLTAADLDEIVTLREALEVLAARLATARWTAADSTRLTALIAAQENARTTSDLNRLDLDFHEAVIRASGHGRLLDAWLPLRPQMERWLATIFREQVRLKIEPRTGTVARHRELLRLFESGNPAAAEVATTEHITTWHAWLHNAHPPRGKQ